MSPARKLFGWVALIAAPLLLLPGRIAQLYYIGHNGVTQTYGDFIFPLIDIVLLIFSIALMASSRISMRYWHTTGLAIWLSLFGVMLLEYSVVQYVSIQKFG